MLRKLSALTFLVAFVLTVSQDVCPPTNTRPPTLFPHETDCTLYYGCNYGEKFLMPPCPVGKKFDTPSRTCVPADEATCGPISATTVADTTVAGETTVADTTVAGTTVAGTTVAGTTDAGTTVSIPTAPPLTTASVIPTAPVITTAGPEGEPEPTEPEPEPTVPAETTL